MLAFRGKTVIMRMWTTMSGNERGKDMRGNSTFISYMEEEKHASKTQLFLIGEIC